MQIFSQLFSLKIIYASPSFFFVFSLHFLSPLVHYIAEPSSALGIPLVRYIAGDPFTLGRRGGY